MKTVQLETGTQTDREGKVLNRILNERGTGGVQSPEEEGSRCTAELEEIIRIELDEPKFWLTTGGAPLPTTM